MKEALKMAMEALEGVLDDAPKVLEASITGGLYEVIQCRDAITAIKEALAQPEKPKYRRGDRLICLETEDYCVIHISGTDRQWVKFPDSHIGVYTNEQVSELFELLPKEPQRKPLTDEEIGAILEDINAFGTRLYTFARAIEAAHGIKEKNNG